MLIDFVYIINVVGTNKYKIGRSNDINRRLRQLQTGSPDKLTLYDIFTCADCSTLEPMIHKTFAKFRLNGEWFKFTDTEITNCRYIIYELIKNINLKMNTNIENACTNGKNDASNLIENNQHEHKKMNHETIAEKKLSEYLKYTCDICQYTTNDKSHYNRHTRSSKHMTKYKEYNTHKKHTIIKYEEPIQKINKDNTIIKCENCDKIFNHKTNYYRHRKHNCKQNHIDDKTLEIKRENETLKKEIELYRSDDYQEKYKKILETIFKMI